MNFRRSKIRSVVFDFLTDPDLAISGTKIVGSSLALVALLSVVAPTIATLTPISILPAVSVVTAAYGVSVLLTDSIFEGMVSAAFVLVTYSADVPLLSVSGPGTFGIVMADVVVVPFTALLLYWDRRNLELGRPERLAFGALATFVLWSYLSVLVSNGPSSTAAFGFALSQTRYLVYLAFGFLLVRRIPLRLVAYPLFVAIAGHSVVAVLKSYRGEAFGFTRLGDKVGDGMGQFGILFFDFSTGLFPGGFAGTSRVLVSIVLLIAPLAVAACVIHRRDGVFRYAPVVFLPVFALLLRISDTDAGFAAFVVGFGAFAMFSLYELGGNKVRSTWESVMASASTVLIAVILFRWDRADGTDAGPDKPGSGGNNAPANSPGKTNGSNTGSDPSTDIVSQQKGTDISPTGLQEDILQLAQAVPGVKSDTLLVRLQQYSAAIDLGIQYPIFGVGGWNFHLVSDTYGLDKHTFVHNTYLAYFAEVGAIGTLAFLVAILLPLAFTVRLALRSDTDRAIVWWSLAAGLLAFHTFAFWESIYTSEVSYGVLWLLNGVIAGAWYTRTNGTAGRSTGSTE